MKPTFKPFLSLPGKMTLDGADRFRMRTDGSMVCLVTPEGAWRAPLPLVAGAHLVPMQLPAGELQNFYVLDGVWYLLKKAGQDAHVFLRSSNQGATWEGLDEGLWADEGGQKSLLMPTRMTLQDDVLFLNGGGGTNFMSSRDDGRHWNLLFGLWGNQMAYAGKLFVRGRTALLGGEAPLDVAYLRRGELGPDLTTWTREPASVAPPGISNRNVQFIEGNPAGPDLFAGVEGGLLKSSDDGMTWRWAQCFESGDGKYPYIQQICFKGGSDPRILVGGFDKANDGVPFLSVSQDAGETWADASGAFGANVDWRNVVALHAEASGRILGATYDSNRKRIDIGELDM